jgi:tripartite motif-containing protein 2/3/tripartite motif-containing protein 71
MVYVSEGDNHRVSVFTSEGRFVMTFGREGEGPGEFKCPYGLAVDNNG